MAFTISWKVKNSFGKVTSRISWKKKYNSKFAFNTRISLNTEHLIDKSYNKCDHHM